MIKQNYEINYKLLSIFRTVLRVNTETKADCFLHFSPHIKWLNIYLYKDGWKEEESYENIEVYSVRYEKYSELEKLEEKLQKILDEELEAIIRGEKHAC